MRRKPQPPGTVNVGRVRSGGVHGGMFGNPFIVGETYTVEEESKPPRMIHCPDASSTLDHYEKWLLRRIKQDQEFAARFEELRGKTLWCPGCGLGAANCHARVIEKVLAQQSTQTGA